MKKTALFFVLFCCVYLATGSQFIPPRPTVHYFNQTFDHFDSSDTRTFQEKYLVYDGYYNNYKGNAIQPLWVIMGGESEVIGGYNHDGLIFEYGKEFGALIISPEHRYYGDSLPFGTVNSFTPENIKGLKIQQALADYIEVIKYVKSQYNMTDDNPVFSVGGSYPGELAMYIRVAYPDVIDAGYASSAPIRYHPFIPDKTNSGAFYGISTRDFAMEDPNCPNYVRTAFAYILDNYDDDEERQKISESLGMCSTLESGDQQLRLFELFILNAFATMTMGNYPYPAEGLVAYPMKESCKVMKTNLDTSNIYSYIENLGQAIGVMYNATGANLSCYNITELYFPCADQTGCGPPTNTDSTSWNYQSCTQIVSDVSTNNVTDMFPPRPYDFDLLIDYCKETYGTVPDPTETTTLYNWKNSSKILFTNGVLDGWFPGGVLSTYSDDIIALVIPDSAHHFELRGSYPEKDPAAVTFARQEVKAIFTKWYHEIIEEKQLKKKLQIN
eukprot:TRINITY_DN13040_c0_g1_i1.p1 TRINITY_DN13040_c0_g1~~TRINITY_DN13040_c0_g1_i1.p1  ORF type:complete len:513 (-),score=184.43 TRINITY_DN13040_c0_g1_i1:87-1583(-)